MANPVLKLSRNAIPALFGKAERHTGTSGDARGGTLGQRSAAAFRLGLYTARLTTFCRLQVYRCKECPCIWCVYVNMVKVKGKASSLDIAPLAILNSGAL